MKTSTMFRSAMMAVAMSVSSMMFGGNSNHHEVVDKNKARVEVRHDGAVQARRRGTVAPPTNHKHHSNACDKLARHHKSHARCRCTCHRAHPAVVHTQPVVVSHRR